MTAKKEAIRIISLHFDPLAKAMEWKGINPDNTQKFSAMEKLAKKHAIVSVNLILELIPERHEFYKNVKEEIERV